jgi:predicted nucleic acid-binding protein
MSNIIVLDTNVVSEIMRPTPNTAVVAWLDAQNTDSLYLCSIVAAELLFGVTRLSSGAKKLQLQTLLNEVLEDDFAGRVLPLDLAATYTYAQLCSQAERNGTPIDLSDALIAASCKAAGASLATRNIKHFEGCGLVLINPWLFES